MTWKPDVMIYHANCDDGFGSAWAAFQRWGDEVEYLPVGYGQPAPDVAGKHVLIGDFSFKRPVLDQMLQGARSIVILDHHKTAQEDLAPFAIELCGTAQLVADDVDGMLQDLAELDRPPCVALFDMDRSGARLTWEFCHPDKGAPALIRYIEDRDLWRFVHKETKAFSLYLRSFRQSFAQWSVIADELEIDIVGTMDQANAIQRFYDQKIGEMVALAHDMDIGRFTVPAVNCPPSFASDVGHALLDEYPDADFVAAYCDGPEKRGVSLRSSDTREDVSAIAKQFGGGGHRNAAGFGIDRP